MGTKNGKRNINIVVESGACNGCCECISSCAENNIYMLFSSDLGHPVPFVAASCDGCGECLRNCEQAAALYCEPAKEPICC